MQIKAEVDASAIGSIANTQGKACRLIGRSESPGLDLGGGPSGDI